MMRSMSCESLVSIPLDDPIERTYVELKPINLDFEYKGKTYQITFVNQKIGTGKEQALDLSKLNPDEIEALKEGAKKSMAAMEQLSGSRDALLASSFTLHFSSTYNEPTLLNKAAAVLGIKRFQYKENPFEIDSISYKDASGAEQKFAVDLSRYDKASKKKIMDDTRPLNKVVQQSFNRTIYQAPPLKLEEPKAPAKREVVDMSHLVVDEEDDLQARLDRLQARE